MSDSETLERAYRMRVYPTSAQRRLLGRLYGSARFVWNWGLARHKQSYATEGKYVGWVALSREFTRLRGAEPTEWLSELPREPFTQVLRDQERAFKSFFAGRACYPRFRRRGGKSSVRFTLDQRRMQVKRGEGKDRWACVHLAGLGRLKLRRTEELLGRLRSITLSRDGAGRYFGSITAGASSHDEPRTCPKVLTDRDRTSAVGNGATCCQGGTLRNAFWRIMPAPARRTTAR